MRISLQRWFFATCWFNLISLAAAADDGVNYQTQVKPLLKGRCYACHGGLKQAGGLRLDTARLILKGSDSGKVITPGENADSSLLLERVAATDTSVRMPPEHEGEPLKEEEIALLRKWIAAGAPAPDDEQPESDPTEHWSFRTVVRPEVPVVKNTAWVRNPIDAWISAGHERHGLTPQPEAPRIVLLRRLTMDLIGLPPTAEEIAAFESDTSPQWYEKAVNRLLEDPRHGERWGRHWMDIWRYSDWWGLGEQLRNSDRHIWHWRDWIVESLNRDTPYDEMLRLMLAADEIAPDDPDKLRATGFLVRNFFIFNRNKWMEDTVEHVSKSMLGLTMNCSKCHDHKFDPVSQVDYYKMRSFFEPYLTRIDMVPGEIDFNKNGIPRAFDGLPDIPTYRFIRGDEAQPDKGTAIHPGVPELLAFDELKVEPVSLSPTASQPGLRPWVMENYVAVARQKLQSAEAKRQAALQVLERTTTTSAEAASNAPRPIQETFETLDPARWRLDGKGWVHSPGKLEQTKDGLDQPTVTLLERAPDNFKAVLRFTINGGSQWQSLGIVFDTTSSENFPGGASETSQQLYVSASLADPKVQFSYRTGGEWSYPGDGRKSMSFELGREYVLELRVRGSLINAAINGEHLLAYRTPIPRRQGSLRLMTFDALATFHEFQLSELPGNELLIDPMGKSQGSDQNDFELADAELKIARAELYSVESRVAATRALQENAAQDLQMARKATAIEAERHLAIAQAEREVLLAQHAHASANDAKKEEAQKKLDEARKKLSEAESLAQSPIKEDDAYTPFTGTRWTATRFRNTGADDPSPALPAQSTGRRLALAKWITDKRNPLTARVAVNHLWNRHFGTPLAPAPFDLGRNSPAPADPQLVDWLASELMEQGWSLKTLHRLIVMSSTYRMSSSVVDAEDCLKKDPDNRYWWRRTPIRIESQAVRDSILSLTGTLDPTMGGPSVMPAQQADSKRRSMYFFHSNNERNLFLTTFDEADVGECYRREQSIVPQQALAMTNSGLVLDSARQIADRISQQSTDDTDFVKRAFALVLCMHPNEAEIAASLNAMKRWKSENGESVDPSRANLIWILMNHNDFVTLR
ncbi:DUF1553 domain-containing protein [Schlesneria sp. T3-172]|uniref:PSD1 and planctomycete cytochrome C domain-containing protein n=1 Tax=Schlesneria sphaerica TaxID=3373610 RepID=UPI0037CBA0E4